MGYLRSLAFLERKRLGVGLRLEVTLGIPTRIALRHGFPVVGLVVPCLKVDTSVHLPCLRTANDISSVKTLRCRSRSGPVIVGIVRSIGAQSIEIRNTVKRHIPRSGKHLLVGVRRAETSQRTLNRVFPGLVMVMVEFLVKVTRFENFRRVFAFVDNRVHGRLEGELHVLRQVIFDIDIAVPSEVFAISEIHIGCLACQVAHFHVTESTMHVHAECPGLRQIVDIHLFEEFHFLHFLYFGEGFPRLRIERICVLERTFMIGGDVFLHLRRVLGLLVVRCREREIGRVVEHIPLLRMDVHLEIRQRERRRFVYGIRHLFDGIALLFRIVSIQCLFEFDIGIQRVIIGTCGLVAVGYVERHLYLGFLRQEASSFECGTHADLIEIVHVPVKHI